MYMTLGIPLFSNHHLYFHLYHQSVVFHFEQANQPNRRRSEGIVGVFKKRGGIDGRTVEKILFIFSFLGTRLRLLLLLRLFFIIIII